MSNLEHYFENLLFNGRDVSDNCNKNALTKEEQFAVEVCAEYVIYSLFGNRDDFKAWLLDWGKKRGETMEWVDAIKIISDMKNCVIAKSLVCGTCSGSLCENEYKHSTSDNIEALQMAKFALEQLIKQEEAEVEE